MYQLLNGNCLELMKDIPDGSIDMILCDLPYGTTRNRWDSVIPFDPLWEQYERVIKDNGAIVLFAQIPFSIELGYSKKKLLRYEWIWEKENVTGFLNANKMPLKNFENILVFYKKLPTYNPQGLIRLEKEITHRTNNKGGRNYGECSGSYVTQYKNYPRSILNFPRDTTRLHPTQKPVILLEYLINTYTNENEIVLDNCMGSGTTGVACINTNRRFIGIEKDEKYFNIATNRIEEAFSLAQGEEKWA